MKKGVLTKGLAVLLVSASILAGCGSSSSTSEYATTDGMAAPAASAPKGSGILQNSSKSYSDDDYATESAAESEADTTDNSTGDVEVSDTSRKLITTISIDAESEDLDTTKAEVEKKVKELGGYIESSDAYNGSSYGGRYSRSASYTIRVPADKADEFVQSVEGTNNVTRKSVNVQDVTLDYVDTESRKKALKTEEERLLAILEKADTVEDIITVESRLAEVRYELESIESQLRTYDNKVDYSTIYLDINEVTQYTPVEKKDFFQRIAEGFVSNLKAVGNWLLEVLIAIITHIPQLVVIAIFVAVVIFIKKKCFKNVGLKRNKKGQPQVQAQPQEQPEQNTEGKDGK